MTTATDEERREVARRLREYDDEETREQLVDCADWGERVLNMLDCGDTEGECCAALADLIEPNYDRDALLALADEIDRKSDDGAVNPDPTKPIASSLDLFGYARSIREAVGA